MDRACVENGLSAAAAFFGALGGTELIVGFLISFALAIPLAPLVLSRYQRRIGQLMLEQSRTASASASPTPDNPAAALVAPSPPPYDAGALADAAARRGAMLLRALILAVGAFALSVAVIFTISPDEPGGWLDHTLPEWIANIIVYAAFVASLCLPIVFLGVESRRFSGLFWKLFAPAFMLTAALGIFADASVSMPEKLGHLGVAALLIVTLYAGIGGRRMRNVVPLLTLFLAALMLALLLFSAATEFVDLCLEPDSLAYGVTGLGLLGVLLWSFTRLAFAALDWLARAYRRKAFSATQFQIGMWTVLIAILFALGAGPAEDELDLWALAILPALAIGIGVYKTRLAAITPWRPPVPLLLLRVFASDARSERLVDEFAFRWRFIGPIFLVGGPDLAKANLEPHELFLFLRRRIGEAFLRDGTELERRLAGMDDRPDPDARYRIEEFFCFDDVWRQAVDALLGLCPVVILDLRGFDATRRGASFEVNLLARRRALTRTVVMVDAQTDLDAVRAALAEVRGASLTQCRMLHIDEDISWSEVFDALLETAAPEGLGAPTKEGPCLNYTS